MADKSYAADGPHEGYFEMRERQGGRLVAVRIWLEDGDREPCEGCQPPARDGVRRPCVLCDGAGSFLMSDQIWHCLVDGAEADPWQVWQWAARRPINVAGYEYRLARSAYDLTRGINRGEPIDLMRTRPAF
jgi:hypothetical protein